MLHIIPTAVCALFLFEAMRAVVESGVTPAAAAVLVFTSVGTVVSGAAFFQWVFS